MDQSFDVADEVVDDVAILTVSGEIDVAAKPTLRTRLDAQLDAGHSTIVVDLREVTFLDSTGLGVLVGALKRCRDVGGDLRLVVEAPRILQLFTITGLDGTFRISPSLEGALGASGN